MPVERCVEDRVEGMWKELWTTAKRLRPWQDVRVRGHNSRHAHAMTATLRLCDVRACAVRRAGCRA